MASTLPNEQFPSCVRCKDSITTGHAYELGCDRWHTHCFSCYKCEKPLSCESDFLVLGTGALICFDCPIHAKIVVRKLMIWPLYCLRQMKLIVQTVSNVVSVVIILLICGTQRPSGAYSA